MMRRAVTYLGASGWREGTIVFKTGVSDATGVRLLPAALSSGALSSDELPSDAPRLDGVITGGFADHHVHLMLVDATALATSRLGRVIDLGGPLGGPLGGERTQHGTAVDFAGAFLTPPGGYPSDRAWALDGSVREVAHAADARRAVIEMHEAGSTCLKIASNSTAGPVFSDEMFGTIVQLAARCRLPVTAHAEGPGEAQRAVRLGATQLAHTPFSERLDDDEIARHAASASWVSTLAIHDGDHLAIALDNLRRFFTAGGTVRYGTDMGNGEMPVDLRDAEIEALRAAGITGDALFDALDPIDPLAPGARLLFYPGQSAQTADPLRARPLTHTDLEF